MEHPTCPLEELYGMTRCWLKVESGEIEARAFDRDMAAAVAKWRADPQGLTGHRFCPYGKGIFVNRESLLEYACREWPDLAPHLLDPSPDLGADAGTNLLFHVLRAAMLPRHWTSGPARRRLIGRLLAAGARASHNMGGDTPLECCVRRPPDLAPPREESEGINFLLLDGLLAAPDLGPKHVEEARGVAREWAWPQLDQWRRWSHLRRAWVAAVVSARAHN